MQRQNSILKPSGFKQKRNAMAMIMAVVTIVIMSTIMALSLSMTTQTTKNTADLYLHEQAILVSKSAAELALLDIARLGSCTTAATAGVLYLGVYTMDLDSDGDTADDIFDVNTSVRYIYDNLACGGTDDYTTITTEEQNGSVLMDITVSTDAGTEPIRYFRRSIQKL